MRNPSAFRLLVASLRSNDVRTRVTAWSGIYSSGLSIKEADNLRVDPRRLLGIFSKPSPTWPEHIVDVFANYGAANTLNTESLRTVKATGEFQKAMMTLVQDRDMYKFGCTLADLVLTTEYSVAEGKFADEGGRSDFDLGLPFVSWVDSLREAAKVVRAHGTPKDLDRADILDAKFFISRHRNDECRAFADKCIARNPTIGFLYYARAIGASKDEGLRFAKKGLSQATDLTPYVELGLLNLASTHAFGLGLDSLNVTHSENSPEFAQGVAFVQRYTLYARISTLLEASHNLFQCSSGRTCSYTESPAGCEILEGQSLCIHCVHSDS